MFPRHIFIYPSRLHSSFPHLHKWLLQISSLIMQLLYIIRQAHLKRLWLNVIAKMLQLNKTILAMIYGSGEEKELWGTVN